MRLPTVLAGLGRVLELRMAHDGKTWTLDLAKSERWMAADASRVGLYILPPPRKTQKYSDELAETAGLEEATRVLRSWSQHDPLDVCHHKVKLGPAKLLGRCVSIRYRSDKWTGRFEDYEHRFRAGGPRVTRHGSLIRISGKGVRVTPGGVVG